MAKVDIKCLTCNEVMGRLIKPVVTEEDLQLYRKTVTCSQGHVDVAQLEPVQDPPAEP